MRLRDIVMDTITRMIHDNVPGYRCEQYALGWFDKGVLTAEDLELVYQLIIERDGPAPVAEDEPEPEPEPEAI